MGSTLRRWHELLGAFATTIMFVDFLLGLWVHEHLTAIRLCLAVAALIMLLGWFFSRYQRVENLVHDVHYKFSQPDNWKVWEAAKHRYRYIGMSGKTLEPEFKRFVSLPHNGFRGCEVQLLLMFPDSLFVQQSLEHELGRRLTETEIATEVSDLRIRIEVTSRAYQQLAREGLKIEVRLYREYCRFWAHFVDDTRIYIAPLLRNTSGLEATVLQLKRGRHDNVLMQYYEDEFARLWESGTPVVLQELATCGSQKFDAYKV
jgi:hypothetical protein